MSWEFKILHALQTIHTPLLDGFFKFITRFGDGGIFWIALTILILIFAKDKRIGVTCGLALSGEALIIFIVKNIVQRPRPCWIDHSVDMLIRIPKDYSFPSGHSGASFAVAVSIFLYNKKYGACALVLASLIVLSRMYLFVHFPTDVLAGMAIGTAAAFVAKRVAGTRVRRSEAGV